MNIETNEDGYSNVNIVLGSYVHLFTQEPSHLRMYAMGFTADSCSEI
jgi:hypothetical protein